MNAASSWTPYGIPPGFTRPVPRPQLFLEHSDSTCMSQLLCPGLSLCSLVAGRYHSGQPSPVGNASWGISNLASQPLGAQSSPVLRGARRAGSPLPTAVTCLIIALGQLFSLPCLTPYPHPLTLYVAMSFFRPAPGRTQTKTLEIAVSMESWGGAEGNAGRPVFGKLWRTPGVPLLIVNVQPLVLIS